MGDTVFRGTKGQWEPWANHPPGTLHLPYHHLGVLPPQRLAVTSIQYVTPQGRRVSPRSIWQGTPVSLQAVTVIQGPVLGCPAAPVKVVQRKRARSAALSGDSNDEVHAFISGVGSVNYHYPNRIRSRQVTSDGEQVMESRKVSRTPWAAVVEKAPEVVTAPDTAAPGEEAGIALPIPVGVLLDTDDDMEVAQPGDPGYASPLDSQVRNKLFEAAVALARHAILAVGSLHDRWARGRLIAQSTRLSSPSDEPWDLEEGGSDQSVAQHRSLLPTPVAPSSRRSTPIHTANNSAATSHHTTPPSPLSPFVYMSSDLCHELSSPCLLPTHTGLSREPTHMIALRARRID